MYIIKNEYINIDNYSPFCHVNEVSEEFRFRPFLLPFIFIEGELRPVHPDTFKDLNLNPKDVKFKKLVCPTSSFRTVFDPENNTCYKLPLLRKITRGVRDLQEKQLQRSERAGELLEKTKCRNFTFLRENCHHSKDPNFNFIERKMPSIEVIPWFSVIKSQKYSREFMIKSIKNMIEAFLFLASRDILLEFHSQNILVDRKGKVYYRDLSDVRSFKDSILKPSYADKLNKKEFMSVIFDRAFCNQNLDHLFRYDTKLGEEGRKEIKNFIKKTIDKYKIEFPDYSMDFPKDREERVPEKTELVHWRK